MKYKITFYSNYAIGTGIGSGANDSIVAKDKHGLPFIPGRTLKGLLREAYIECGLKNETKLFGQSKGEVTYYEDLKEGKLRFNSAYIANDLKDYFLDYKHLIPELYRTKTSTKLDINKQAVNNTLRKNEVCIPITLKASITALEEGISFEEDFFKTFKMLKIMGENRHRGLGRCIVEPINIENDNT